MQTSNSPLLFWVGIITMTKTMTKKKTKTKTMTMTLTFFRCIHKCSLSTVICQVTFTVSICQRRLEVKAWIMYPLAAICSQQIHKVLKWRQGGGGWLEGLTISRPRQFDIQTQTQAMNKRADRQSVWFQNHVRPKSQTINIWKKSEKVCNIESRMSIFYCCLVTCSICFSCPPLLANGNRDKRSFDSALIFAIAPLCQVSTTSCVNCAVVFVGDTILCTSGAHWVQHVGHHAAFTWVTPLSRATAMKELSACVKHASNNMVQNIKLIS